ncbi:MAG TPA: integrase core domain-containing protein [Afipia sp.]
MRNHDQKAADPMGQRRRLQIVIENWRQHYNTVRPHSSLGYKPPAPEAAVWLRQNGPASTPAVASRPSMH